MTEDEIAAREQFEYHRRRHDELCDAMLRNRAEAAAHHQIMEGLALLHPSLRRDYADSIRPDPAKTHGDGGPPRPPILHGGPEPHSRTIPDNTPRFGIAAIRDVLGAHPGAQFTVNEIFKLLEDRGWAPSQPRVVRNTLNRALEQGLVDKYESVGGTVTYAWKSPRFPRDTGRGYGNPAGRWPPPRKGRPWLRGSDPRGPSFEA